MLADTRANALVDNFAGQWLHLRELGTVTPEVEGFDENLREAFIEETRSLVDHLRTADRPVTELLTADYTFLNERLARHYGIPGVRGSYFRKVQLPPGSHRRGLLGHGSILTVTSTASRTSPVIRGSWILENLLSAPVPAPPPGVETNIDGDGTQVITTSVRQRLELHRKNPSCASCHNIMDPVGFALENYDAIGAWRERDGNSPIDATGTLVDGTKVVGPEGLTAALMANSELFVTNVTEKLLIYALGRALEPGDMPTVRAIVRSRAPRRHALQCAGSRRGAESRLPAAHADRCGSGAHGAQVRASNGNVHHPQAPVTSHHAAGSRHRARVAHARIHGAGHVRARRHRHAAHALRRHLFSARRHHVALDAEGRRPRFHLQRDPEAARAASRAHHRHLEPGSPAGVRTRRAPPAITIVRPRRS